MNSKILILTENIYLKKGNHTLKIAYLEESTPILKEKLTFTGDGYWKLDKNNILTVNDGILLTQKQYSNINLNLQFKVIKFGIKSWHTPAFYIYHNSSTFLKLTFHKEKYIELTKKTPQKFSPEILTRNININLKKWNNLQIKIFNGTIKVYLNKKPILTYKDPILNNPGMIGLSSEKSTTQFKNIFLTTQPNQVEAIMIQPKNQPVNQFLTILKIKEQSPSKIMLEVEAKNGEAILVLGENYDKSWEVKIDNKPVNEHYMANLYANCWVLNLTLSKHKIKIEYFPSNTNKLNFYISTLTLLTLSMLSIETKKKKLKTFIQKYKQKINLKFK